MVAFENCDNSLTLRRGTIDDLDAIVALHMKCFSPAENIAMQFGENFVQAAYQWILTASITFVVVAEKREKIVGFTAVCDRQYSMPMFWACRKQALFSIVRHPTLAFHRELLPRLLGIFFPRRRRHYTDGTSAQIIYNAVSPTHRSLGLATLLQAEAMRICYLRGHKYLISGIRRDNHANRRVAEKNGFWLAEDLCNKTYVYMIKELQPREQNTSQKKEEDML
jgi:GNAT superfamily N-acetyltransferase